MHSDSVVVFIRSKWLFGRGIMFSFWLPLFCPSASHHAEAERKNGLERISLLLSTRNLAHSGTRVLIHTHSESDSPIITYSVPDDGDITGVLSKLRLSNLVGNEEMRHCRACKNECSGVASVRVAAAAPTPRPEAVISRNSSSFQHPPPPLRPLALRQWRH